MRNFSFYIILLTAIVLSACSPSAKLSKYKAYRLADQHAQPIPPGAVKVTFFGTSSLLIDDGETQLLTDGFVTRPGFIKAGFGKIESDSTLVKRIIKEEKIDRLKAVFVVHSHYDHVLDAPTFSKLTTAGLYGSASTLQVARAAKVPASLLHTFETGKALTFGKFTVTILPSRHTPPFNILGKSNDDLGETIDSNFTLPAKTKAFTEGGAYDVLIEHNGKRLLIKASTNYIEGRLDDVQADVLFLGIAQLGKQGNAFKENFYKYTVLPLKPKLLIPIHWDNFFKPLNNNLKPLPKIADNLKQGLDFIIRKTEGDKISLKIVQGKESVILFTESKQ
jgi:L-ascorbate metabolism protein UlaG (beta-lactamase superfamily)